jgi:hypothetical protein
MPRCHSRLSANMLCSLLVQPILAVHSLRQSHQSHQFPLFTKGRFLRMTCSGNMVYRYRNRSGSVPPWRFCFLGLLSQPKSFVRNIYEAHRVSQGRSANKLFGINAYKAAAKC